MPVTLKPLRNKLVVRRLDMKGKSPGGILIPEKAQKKSGRCVVLAVGPGRDLESRSFLHMGEKKDGSDAHYEVPTVPIPVKVGETILINDYAGTEYIDDDTKETWTIIEDTDIIAVEVRTDG